MNACKALFLFGSLDARVLAKGILENHPKIRRIDSQNGHAHLKLLLDEDIGDMELLQLIKPSGLSGLSIY